MKTTQKQFEIFKAEFLKWQKELGLQGYIVYFVHKKLKNVYARIQVDEPGRVVTLFYNSRLEKHEIESDPGPKSTAKHEALHLLSWRVDWLGSERFIGCNDIRDEIEKIVVVLEKLLVDL